MGLFDTLFGSNSSAKSSSATSGSSAQQTSQTTNTSGSSAQTSSAGGVTNTLDPATLQLLQGLTASFAGKTGGQSIDAATLRNLSEQLSANATDTKALDASIGTQQEEATRNFQTGEGQQINSLEQQIGGKGNTYSQLLEQSGNADLQGQLSNIFASTKVQEQANKTAGLTAAANATTAAGATDVNEQAAPVQNLISLVGALKGGQTSTDNTSSSLDLTSLLSSITGNTNTQTTGNTNTVGKQSSNNGVIGALQSILNL